MNFICTVAKSYIILNLSNVFHDFANTFIEKTQYYAKTIPCKGLVFSSRCFVRILSMIPRSRADFTHFLSKVYNLFATPSNGYTADYYRPITDKLRFLSVNKLRVDRYLLLF